jgi:exosortase
MTRIIERLAVWGAIVSSLWFLFGARFLRTRPFPYFYLLLCIPPPFFLLSPVRLALKSFATRLASDALVLLGFPARPEGNILAIAEIRLEVADACSGIRSLMAVTATAVLLAYLFRMGFWKGTLLTATAIPITVVVNVLRLVVIAVALTSFQIDLTSGWSHDMLGFAVFGISLSLLFAASRFVEWFFLWTPTRKEATRP